LLAGWLDGLFHFRSRCQGHPKIKFSTRKLASCGALVVILVLGSEFWVLALAGPQFLSYFVLAITLATFVGHGAWGLV